MKKTTNKKYRESIASLNKREKAFFDYMCYILNDEELALGYVGGFEEIAEQFEDGKIVSNVDIDKLIQRINKP